MQQPDREGGQSWEADCATNLRNSRKRWCSLLLFLTSGPNPGVRLMLFMVIENFASGQAPEVYRRFRDRGRMAPEGLRYISSWVDLNFERCFQLMEAQGVEVLTEWIANWDDLVDFEIVPVRTSEEAAAVIAPQL